MNNKYYTVAASGGYLGKSKDFPKLKYGPVRTRSAALSGIKRMTAKDIVAKPKAKLDRLKVNHIALVIDVSGSMRSLLGQAVTALNKNIQTILDESAKTGQVTYVTVYAFDDKVYLIRQRDEARNIRSIDRTELGGGGGTALFDATGRAINDLKRIDPNYPWTGADNSYLVQVITDGEENTSQLFGNKGNPGPIQRAMKEVQATDLWTLTFLVPNGNKRALVALGIPEGNVAEWDQSTAGVEAYTQSNDKGFTNYFSSRAVGQTMSTSFYTDLSDLKPKDVKRVLSDLSQNIKVLQVDQEAEIKKFVEKKLGSYNKGSAFYQLTKGELNVQSYKELLVMEKGKRSIFGGPDARQVLGIPEGRNLKIKPGNHGNFDIFVQSTSQNRKLVRGTKLLVKV